MSAPALYTTDDIYRLLPAVYRIRDDELGGVLHELVEVITAQVNALAEGIEQAYDDQFIETCAEWVTPYIGDLISYRTLHGEVPRVASPRAEVANTVRYRRRKGTASMLEQLARDVTGWPARAVEFFELLATSQYMNHVRPHAQATASVRDAVSLDIGDGFQAGAFDGLSHTAEMRRIATSAGRYNIPNVGIFLWRVEAHRLTRSPLVDADGSGRRYRFDPLGTDKPLFGAARTEEEITHLAEPFDVPLPLKRRWASAHLPEYYGAGLSMLLEIDDGTDVVPVEAVVRICDLSDDPVAPGAWAHEPEPPDERVAIDPVRGRVAFPSGASAGDTRVATFHYGAALSIGGGGYDRGVARDEMLSVASASKGEDLAPLLGAAAAGGAVEIADSYRYSAPATITVTTPAPNAADRKLVVRSVNRARPLLIRSGQMKLAMDADTHVVLDGLMLAGAPLVIEESPDARPRTLELRHCTLVPGIARDSAGEPAFFGRAGLIV
ncbi:MAG TPA: hypothetical protein VIG64_11190, partial [Actinomycetota bacterium]